MEGILEKAVMIFAFFAILFAAYLTTRFVGSRAVRITRGKYIKVIDKIVLANDRWLCVVQVGEEYCLIGVTGNNITLLKDISSSSLIPLEIDNSNQFNNIFSKYMNNRKKKDIKDIKKGFEQQFDFFKKQGRGRFGEDDNE